MTTIIMISHNSSVIINHSGEDEGGGEEEDDEKKLVTDNVVTNYDRHISNGMTFPISSSTSQSSSTTSTPDASFITPRPLSKTSPIDNIHRKGRSPHRRRLKNSLSTLESDSEDMNTTTEGSSGGSAASTLSSAAYILSSVTYFPSLPEETYGRVTIGSDASNIDHSFSCAVTSTPAHHNNNNNNNNGPGSVRSPMNGPHGIKFYVDPSSGRIDLKTPSDCVVAGSLDRRRANQKFPSSVHQPRSMSVSQMSAFATPATVNSTSTYKRLLPSSVSSYCTLTRNKGQRLLPDESVLRSGGVFKVPSSHLSASSIGPAVTCHSSGISTGSVSSHSSENRSESEKRRMRSRKEEQKNVSKQFDRSRRGSFKSYSQWRSSSVKIRVRSCQSEEEGKKRRPLSELMSIKGSHEDIEDVVDQFLDRKELEKSSAISSSCSSIASSESSSKFRPIGAAVLPTGWHRHPHHNHQHHSLPMRRCQSVDEEDEDQEEVRKKKCQRNLFGANSSENEKEEDCWFLDGNFVSLQLNENEDNVGDERDDDCDDIQSWLSRDNVMGSAIFETSLNNKSSRERSRRGLKFVPSSVLNSRILRRHTTYIKSMDNVMASLMTSQSEKSPDNCDQTNQQRPPHVHSWHKRGPKWEDLNNNNNSSNKKRQQQVGTYGTTNNYKFFSNHRLFKEMFYLLAEIQ